MIRSRFQVRNVWFTENILKVVVGSFELLSSDFWDSEKLYPCQSFFWNESVLWGCNNVCIDSSTGFHPILIGMQLILKVSNKNSRKWT